MTCRLCSMNYTRLIFTIFLAVIGILVFAIWSNNNSIYVYTQQSYSPSTSPASPTQLSQLPQQTNSTGNGSIIATNLPIVLRPLPGGTCPLGYHLVSGTVCIKDITPPASQSTSTPAIPPNNTTNSFSIPSPSASQLNGTNPTNNDNNSADANNQENFNTTILKSYNQEFK